jgi:ABC-2 type transport system permease protein
MRWFGLSGARMLAILLKEFRQMRRDRLTFAMLVGVPVMQLVLFGYAINTDPRHLPLALVVADDSPVVRAFVAGLQNSQYFDVVAQPASGARSSAASGRRCWWPPTPPTLRRPATRWRHWSRSRARPRRAR